MNGSENICLNTSRMTKFTPCTVRTSTEFTKQEKQCSKQASESAAPTAPGSLLPAPCLCLCGAAALRPWESVWGRPPSSPRVCGLLSSWWAVCLWVPGALLRLLALIIEYVS